MCLIIISVIYYMHISVHIIDWSLKHANNVPKSSTLLEAVNSVNYGDGACTRYANPCKRLFSSILTSGRKKCNAEPWPLMSTKIALHWVEQPMNWQRSHSFRDLESIILGDGTSMPK